MMGFHWLYQRYLFSAGLFSYKSMQLLIFAGSAKSSLLFQTLALDPGGGLPILADSRVPLIIY